MPYKVNEKRRHRISKARYRVKNWRSCDAALGRRGDLTVWVTPAAMAAWTPPCKGRRGRPQHYSAITVETGLLGSAVCRIILGGVRTLRAILETSSSALTVKFHICCKSECLVGTVNSAIE